MLEQRTRSGVDSGPGVRAMINRRRFFTGAAAAGAAAWLPSPRAAAGEATAVAADVPALALSGTALRLERAAVQELRASLAGQLLVGGDAGYEAARRVWNAMIDRHPALIARCASAVDVSKVVTFARERGLLVAVRGGGHSFPGYSSCEGGLLIDLSQLNQVSVDAQRRVVHAGGGALGLQVDGAAQQHALATTLGQISNTGIGGLTLGGGLGWLSRRFGLACDNLLSAEIVTADGHIRLVGPHDDPDLYWAIRGGGGNFGVATQFEYRLHEVPQQVISGRAAFQKPHARDAVAFYADFLARAPRELAVDLDLSLGGDGKTTASIFVVYSGDPRNADKVLAPLRAVANAVETKIGPQSYLVVQSQFDTPAIDTQRHYIKGGFVNEYPAPLIDYLSNEFEATPGCAIYFESSNGAVWDTAADATAFSHRHAMASLMVMGAWDGRDQDEAGKARVRSVWERLAPFCDGYYVNLADPDPKTVDANYGANHRRLAALKRKYDPQNLFRLNANIKPA
jgi:FAD/FMN-containing dehydrogenase